MLRILMILFFIVSCSSAERTKYGKYHKDRGGYQDKKLEDNLRVVSFKGNSLTKPKLAQKFAKFRAIEICTKEKYKLTHLLDQFDKTQSKTITRSNSYGYPSYYYGMSPFYSRYSGFGYGFGFNTMSGRSWNETLLYPDIEVIFECANAVFAPEITFKGITAEDMKLLIKDLRGGLQVISPDKKLDPKSGIQNGDIIIYGDGERVEQTYQLLNLFHRSQDHNIRVSALRNGTQKDGLLLRGIDISDKILQAQNKIIKSACKHEDVKEEKLCK